MGEAFGNACQTVARLFVRTDQIAAAAVVIGAAERRSVLLTGMAHMISPALAKFSQRAFRRALQPASFSFVSVLTLALVLLSAPVLRAETLKVEDVAKQPGLPTNSLIIHYHDSQKQYAELTIWSWDLTGARTPAEPANELLVRGETDFGAYFVLDLDLYGAPEQPKTLGFLPRYQKNWDLKDGTDRTWKEHLGREIFMIRGDQQLYSQQPDLSPRIISASLEADDAVVLQLSAAIQASKLKPTDARLTDEAGRSYHVLGIRSNNGDDNTKWLRVTASEALPFTTRTIKAALEGYTSEPELVPRGVLADPVRFYDATVELGAVCAAESTTFRLFAPNARLVAAVLYDQATGPDGRTEVAMKLGGRGVWEGKAEGDLHGKYYMFRLEGPGLDPKNEVIDPYSRANSGRDGRGQVVNLRRTDPEGFRPIVRPPQPSENGIVVWEIHVRDFSIDPNSGIQAKGKYLGFTERGTTLVGHPEVKTGLDHALELGVTHLQLLPIQDFDNNEGTEDYNWGYMPSYFNSPDGWYASEVRGLSRVTEFKQLVKACHDAGLRVIIDVVYNHTDNTCSFDKIIPGYYYRMTPDGRYSNGSGTGNEFFSERPMARKFIVDSCKYWVEEYGVDGFRFDLMGLTDKDTMVAVKEAVQSIDSTVLVWGEPWTGGSAMVSVSANHHNIRGTGLAAFNDHIRDQIKGSTRGTDGAFIQAGVMVSELQTQIEGGFRGHAQEVTEVLNYVEAHDDNVLWDKLKKSAPHANDKTRARMQMMAGAILTTAVGKVFLHAGQEMLRTKDGVENSYNAPDDVNQIDWDWKVKNRESFDYHAGLIHLRRAHPVFHMTDRAEVEKRLRFQEHRPTGKSLAYTFDGRDIAGETWKSIHVIHNADTRSHEFTLPAPGMWTVVVHDGKAGLEPLGEATDKVTVPPHTSTVLWQ